MIIVCTIKERLKKSFLFFNSLFKKKDGSTSLDNMKQENNLANNEETEYLSNLGSDVISYINSLRSYLSIIARTILDGKAYECLNERKAEFIKCREDLSLKPSDEFVKASITFTNFYLEKGKIIGTKEDVTSLTKTWMDEFFKTLLDNKQIVEEIAYKYEIAMLLNTLLIINELGYKTCYKS